jgi:hypothetical protein
MSIYELFLQLRGFIDVLDTGQLFEKFLHSSILAQILVTPQNAYHKLTSRSNEYLGKYAAMKELFKKLTSVQYVNVTAELKE